jgi:hypothetical protein
VLDLVTCDARQPIVGVDDVGATRPFDVVEDSFSEGVDNTGQQLFAQLGVASIDMYNAYAGFDLHLRWEITMPAPYINRAINVAVSKRSDQLAHVHVHPTRVTFAGLGKGGSVQREHGNAELGARRQSHLGTIHSVTLTR